MSCLHAVEVRGADPLTDVVLQAGLGEAVEITTGASSSSTAAPEGPSGEPAASSGPASGSASAPAAPPIPRPLKRVLPPRPTCDQVVVIPGGILHYYYNLDRFTATRLHGDHGRCILSRASISGRKRGQGRPLGLLSAWLLWSEKGPCCATREQHWDQSNEHYPKFESRQAARDFLWTVDGGPEMMACERMPVVGETEDEPAVVT